MIDYNEFISVINKIERNDFSSRDKNHIGKLYESKTLYTLSNHPDVLIKKVKDVKEYFYMRDADTIIPRITAKIFYYHKNYVLMEKIDGISVADMYGEDANLVPQYIWDQIRSIIRILSVCLNIWYIDITPYNFIMNDEGNVFIIDFEHCNQSPKCAEYMADFLHYKINKWNPEFN